MSGIQRSPEQHQRTFPQQILPNVASVAFYRPPPPRLAQDWRGFFLDFIPAASSLLMRPWQLRASQCSRVLVRDLRKSRPVAPQSAGRGAHAICALPEEKPRLLKKTGPEADSVRPLKSPVSPSAPTRNVAFGSAPCLICALG